MVVNRRVDDTAAAQLSVDYADRGQGARRPPHRASATAASRTSPDPPSATRTSCARQGLGELAREHPDLEILTVSAGSSMEAGYDAADAVLETGATAAIAFNDLVALGLLSRLREVGVDVPEQLSIVGIDDIPQSRFAAPPLTTHVGAADRDRPAGVESHAPGDSTARPPTIRCSTARCSSPRQSSGPASHASGWVGPARPVLRLGSTVVAQYEEGATRRLGALAPSVPRQRRSRAPARRSSVTEPTDHPHHLGVSLAIPDVNGTSYWGGRTYVRGEGSIMVPEPRPAAPRPTCSIDGHSLDERLSWVDEHGTTQLVEVRELRSAELANGWALRWRSHLKATLDAITFGSPATNGRDGAGYGGVFWRFAPEIARVFSPAGDTERDVHGAATPWLAFTFPERGTTVVLAQGEDAAAVVRPLRRVPRRRPGDRVGRAAHDPRGRRAQPRADRLRPRRGARRRGRRGAGPAGAARRGGAVTRTAPASASPASTATAAATSTPCSRSPGRRTRRRRRPPGRRRRARHDAASSPTPSTMIDAGGLDIVVLSTPIPTHAELRCTPSPRGAPCAAREAAGRLGRRARAGS